MGLEADEWEGLQKHWPGLIAIVRDAERELERERARLDWLSARKVTFAMPSLATGHHWPDDAMSLRDKIDRAMDAV